MKLIYYSGLTVTIFFISSCNKTSKETPYQYNQKLISIISEVDSSRVLIGSPAEEKQEETLRDFKNLKRTIKTGLQKIDSVPDYNGDTLFRNSVKGYLLTNEKILKYELVILATIKDRILEKAATPEEIQYGLQVNDQVQARLDSANMIIQKAQISFANKNRLKLQ
jgi:hypothetical protein